MTTHSPLSNQPLQWDLPSASRSDASAGAGLASLVMPAAANALVLSHSACGRTLPACKPNSMWAR